MNGSVSLLVVLAFGDPHLLEGVERGQDAATDPGGVEPLLGCRNPDLDIFGSKLLHFRQQTVAEAFEKGGAALKKRNAKKHDKSHVTL